MKKITLLAMTSLLVSNAQAQLSIIPVAGINLSNYRRISDFPSEQYKSRVGYCAGALVDIALTERLSLQPGILYKLNGYVSEDNNAKLTYSYNTIEIPVKLVYSFIVGKGSRLFIGAGPYAAINVSGKSHVVGDLTFGPSMTVRHVDETANLDIGSYHEIQRFDMGAGLSVGLMTRKGIFVSAQGQYGFKDLSPSGSPIHFHNYNFGITGGYSFKLKKHKQALEKSDSQVK